MIIIAWNVHIHVSLSAQKNTSILRVKSLQSLQLTLLRVTISDTASVGKQLNKAPGAQEDSGINLARQSSPLEVPMSNNPAASSKSKLVVKCIRGNP